MTTTPPVGVVAAAVQATPVFLDREATVERCCALITEASTQGAGLVGLPEAFIPGYPDWVWRTPAWDDSEFWDVLFEQAVDVPGPAVGRLCEAAADGGVWVAVGVNERAAASSTLYNTLLYLSPDGRLAGLHRKLMPTGGERTVWGQGDGSTLTVLDTPFGRLGGLICWENYMPLARAAMWAQRVDVFLAPTWDNSDTWVATLRHVAKEGRVHVVGTNTCIRSSDVPHHLRGAERIYGGDDWMSRGNTAIVGPDGMLLAGPLVGETGILYAELDVAAARRGRREFDPIGHYARADVFRLVVDDRPVPFASSWTTRSRTGRPAEDAAALSYRRMDMDTMTELAGVGVTVREAADAVEADSGASPVLVAVVREFLSKADKVTRLEGDGGLVREGVVELEQAGDSAKAAVEADTGVSEATTRAVQAAHLAICMLKART